MRTGTEKWLIASKGVGLIAPGDDGPDVFTHSSAIEGSRNRGMSEWQKVDLEVEQRTNGRQTKRAGAL